MVYEYKLHCYKWWIRKYSSTARVRRDEREEANGLAGPGGHLQDCVTFGVQGALQVHHVVVP